MMVVLLIVSGVIHNASAQSSTTCDDFTYQQEAQKAWDDGDGQRRQNYMTGMDEDNDGIACEHLPGQPAFYETLWFRILIGAVVVLGVVGLWWSRKVKAANATRDEPILFPGRSSTEEVEDQLALLRADKAIDEVEGTPQNQRQ